MHLIVACQEIVSIFTKVYIDPAKIQYFFTNLYFHLQQLLLSQLRPPTNSLLHPTTLVPFHYNIRPEQTLGKPLCNYSCLRVTHAKKNSIAIIFNHATAFQRIENITGGIHTPAQILQS